MVQLQDLSFTESGVCWSVSIDSVPQDPQTKNIHSTLAFGNAIPSVSAGIPFVVDDILHLVDKLSHLEDRPVQIEFNSPGLSIWCHPQGSMRGEHYWLLFISMDSGLFHPQGYFTDTGISARLRTTTTACQQFAKQLREELSLT